MIESPLEYSFEDLFVGQKANFLKKIDEGLVNNFAKISGDFNPLHMSNEYASTTNFGKRVCHGMLLSSFFSRLVGMYLPGKNALYFSQNLNFVGPCFIGDRIIVKGEVIDKSEAARMIKIETTIKNKEGKFLIKGNAQVMIR